MISINQNIITEILDKNNTVWFEAVLGYISATKILSQERGNPDLWKEYWQDPNTKYVAFIGKDNIVFHTIIFPAMLKAWNDNNEEKYLYPQMCLPMNFLNFEGKKFSKSRGWGPASRQRALPMSGHAGRR